MLEDKDKDNILEYIKITFIDIAQWAVRGGIGKKLDFQKRGPNFMFAYILNRK